MRLRAPQMPPVPVVAAALAAVLALGGCGGGEGGGGTSGAAPAPDPAEVVPGVTFSFGPDGLTPALARVAVGPARVLSVALTSADGRPHGAVITVGGRRTRLVASPGQTAARLLQGVRPGRYRLVPDGATEPVVLLVTSG